MEQKKILITDKVHPLLIKGLESANCVVTYDTSIDNTRLDDVIHQFDGIIINSKIIMNQSRIDKGKSLLFIARLGSGLEIIDVNYAKKKKIAVYNSPEGNRNAAAEHELGMLLALMNNIVERFQLYSTGDFYKVRVKFDFQFEDGYANRLASKHP